MEHRRRKKKLTADERLAYRLCLAHGVLHPDYLLPFLTWEQFSGWRKYECEEPWGEQRADDRAAANTFWILRAEELPELTHPYFRDRESIKEQIQKAEKQKQDMSSPEMQAKLKAVREKHWAAKRKATNGDNNS